MNAIEPNVVALLVFTILAVGGSVGFYVLVGAFPLETRPDLRHRSLAPLLVAADVVLLAAVVGGSLVYAWSSLRWTSVVIVTGLALLFAPGLFNAWPSRWRDGVAGLATMAAGFAVMLGLLHHLGAFAAFS